MYFMSKASKQSATLKRYYQWLILNLSYACGFCALFLEVNFLYVPILDQKHVLFCNFRFWNTGKTVFLYMVRSLTSAYYIFICGNHLFGLFSFLKAYIYIYFPKDV